LLNKFIKQIQSPISHLMKNLLIITAIALLPCMAMAQESKKNLNITDTTKNLAREEYCIVTPRGKSLSTKLYLDVDRGQHITDDDDQKTLLDNNRRPLVFNSLADGLNYMARQGWIYVNTLPVRNEFTSYLFRRALPVQGVNIAETK
jgi:hypothetical protein